MTIRMQRERLDAGLWADAMPLLRAHYAELETYPDIPLDVDTEAYVAADAAGMVRCFTAREDGALIAYALFFVRPNLHCQGSVQATQDVLYLAPDFRGTGTGRRFLAWCDEQLRTHGVQVVYHSSKLARPFDTTLLALGYTAIETLFARRLDD